MPTKPMLTHTNFTFKEKMNNGCTHAHSTYRSTCQTHRAHRASGKTAPMQFSSVGSSSVMTTEGVYRGPTACLNAFRPTLIVLEFVFSAIKEHTITPWLLRSTTIMLNSCRPDELTQCVESSKICRPYSLVYSMPALVCM